VDLIVMGKHKRFTCIGFIFLNKRPQFTDPEDYLDYLNRVWSVEDVDLELEMGILPPGMLLKAIDGNQIEMVVGRYNEPQRVELLENVKLAH
jgi:hypothetical protein